MIRNRKLVLTAFVGGLFLSSPGMAQDFPFVPDPLASLIGSFTFSVGPSAIGSDGTLYEATSYYSFSLFGSKESKDSKLRSYKPDSSKSSADGTLTFSGYATHLGIGKSDQLFLIVSSLSTRGSSAGSTLYLIGKNLLSAAAWTPLEALARDAYSDPSGSINDAKKVELKGYATSLKVKEVATTGAPSKEYLYIHTTEYQFSPFKLTTKLVIVDSSTGKAVRETTIE